MPPPPPILQTQKPKQPPSRPKKLPQTHTTKTGLNQLQRSLLPLRQTRHRARRARVPGRPAARVRPEPDAGGDWRAGEVGRWGLWVLLFLLFSLSLLAHAGWDGQLGREIDKGGYLGCGRERERGLIGCYCFLGRDSRLWQFPKSAESAGGVQGAGGAGGVLSGVSGVW